MLYPDYIVKKKNAGPVVNKCNNNMVKYCSAVSDTGFINNPGGSLKIFEYNAIQVKQMPPNFGT